MNSQTHGQDLDQSIYKTNKGLILLLILIGGFSFVVGFLLNFSLEDKLVSLIETNVKYNKKCPTSYRKLDISYLFPKVRMMDVSLSSRCIGTRENVKLKRLESSLAFPSFSPAGLSFNTNVSDKFSKINISSVHNINSNYFNIQSKKLNARTLSPFLKNVKLAGDFKVNSNIGLKKMKLDDLKLKIESKNFSIPAQNIQGFDLPNLNLGALLVKAKLKSKKKLIVEEVVVGKELSPIRAKITGSIDMDKYNFSRSKMNLTATVKFSSAFIESFSILNLFLDQSKQDEQGFYKFKITGTIARPNKPQILNP
jgi:type II secretion system protein N